jgi:magnesium transporter
MTNNLENKSIDIKHKLEEEIIELINTNKFDEVISILSKLHISEIVDLLEVLDVEKREIIFKLANKEFYLQALLWLPSYLIQEIIITKGLNFVIEIIKDIKDLDAPYIILKDLEDDERKQILDKLSIQTRRIIEKKLNYPKDSAGRLMQSYFISVLDTWSVGQVIHYLQEIKKTSNLYYPDNISEIFIVNDKGEAVGSLSLYNLFSTDNKQNILEIKNANFKTIHTTIDQEEVALIFRNRDFVTAGVVDDDNILVGLITIDDVVDVIYKEAEEDMLLLSGISKGASGTYKKIFSNAQSRLKWLSFNLLEAITIPYIVILFDKTIKEHVIITALIQFVIALGGNAGAQSLSITIRGLALKLISPSNVYKQIRKELLIALINGFLIGLIGFAWGFFYGNQYIFGVIAFMAVLINVLLGTIFGIMYPMLLKKIGVDPAIASAVCVTTSTDIVGFFLVLVIATSLLG